MLDETEVDERARYCCCVFLQLSWLYENDSIEPALYPDYLAKSSLDLGSDEFITMTIEESAWENRQKDGLRLLISLYEGFTHAFCQVLEKSMDEIRAKIPLEFLKKLAEEMGVDNPATNL
jgi:hypothetical protein